LPVAYGGVWGDTSTSLEREASFQADLSRS